MVNQDWTYLEVGQQCRSLAIKSVDLMIILSHAPSTVGAMRDLHLQALSGVDKDRLDRDDHTIKQPAKNCINSLIRALGVMLDNL